MSPVPSDLIPGQSVLIPRGGPEAPRVVDFLPWAFPPEYAVHFDVVDVQTVGAGASATINIVNTGVNRAIIRWFGNESTLSTGYADLRWTILLNGVAKEPYNLMRESRGLISDPDPVLIQLGQGILVQVRVDNVGVAGLEAKTRVKGWVF